MGNIQKGRDLGIRCSVNIANPSPPPPQKKKKNNNNNNNNKKQNKNKTKQNKKKLTLIQVQENFLVRVFESLALVDPRIFNRGAQTLF